MIGHDPNNIHVLDRWIADWNHFAYEALGVRLDNDQEEIVHSVQHNSRTIVKSGHARGKDFTCGVVANCALFLQYPSIVLSTGPTDRQVKQIMLAETKRIWQNAKVPLGGRFIADGIRFDEDPTWYLMGFKTSNENVEAWTGFHSPNPTVIITEGSGVPDTVYNTIEGLLTGNSRLLIVLNPNEMQGECYNAFRSKQYRKFTLNCLKAPNVLANKIIYPGQVDRRWVDTLVHKPGWTQRISKSIVDEQEYDFEWNGQWFRPSNLFRVKVLGEFPKESSDQLIPLSWVEQAQERWKQHHGSSVSSGERKQNPNTTRSLGVDVAGMGSDSTVFCDREDNDVLGFDVLPTDDHMTIVGEIKERLKRNRGVAFIDAIGEGAGVYSRCAELKIPCESVKFSEGALDMADLTGEREYANMRSYCWWAIRDALDPDMVSFGGGRLMLPPDDELVMDLTVPKFKLNSQGRILIELKADIKKRLGRSTDRGDSLANTYYPGKLKDEHEFIEVEDMQDYMEEDPLFDEDLMEVSQ